MAALPARLDERFYTAAEFETLPEFDEPYELIEGKLVKKAMPNSENSLIARILTRQYDAFDPQEKLGRMLQEVSTVLNVRNTPAPDVAFWQAGRKPKRSQKAAGRPDLAIEIWSPHHLDTKKRREEAREKIQRYLAAGVPLVWAINPQNQTVEVYHAGSSEIQILDKSDLLSGEEIIPGFELPVAVLFDLD
jgi:Uma2 family endonuclease